MAGSNVTQSSVQAKSSVAQSVSKPASNIKPTSLQSANKPSSDSKTVAAASTLIHSTQTKPSSFNSATFHATSDDDDSKSSSVGVGKGGSKFMKKRIQSVTEIPDMQDNRPTTVEKPRQLNCCVSLLNYWLLTVLLTFIYNSFVGIGVRYSMKSELYFGCVIVMSYCWFLRSLTDPEYL